MRLTCGKHPLDLTRPQVMGVLNVTPDSFSDGGHCYNDGVLNLDLALRRAAQMYDEGAAIIDVGGESTRPGSAPVSEQQELDRVLPVVEAIALRLDVIVSIDTSNARLMREAAAVGAGLINDVRALTRPGALLAAAATGLPVCLMHMQGEPGTMQQQPEYQDLVSEVRTYLQQRLTECVHAGIQRSRVLFDPGFGFGKTDRHNLILLKALGALAPGDIPVLAGLSRKSMIGRLLGRELGDRLPGSLALALLAAQRGARILRVHDVAATIDVLRIHQLLELPES